jgi:hypothetical protein
MEISLPGPSLITFDSSESVGVSSCAPVDQELSLAGLAPEPRFVVTRPRTFRSCLFRRLHVILVCKREIDDRMNHD